MSERLWEKVDDYFDAAVVRPDAALEAALEASDAAGLPRISVSAAHGKLLFLLARLIDAHRILEVGTLGGYSTIWLARGLAPGGKLVSLEAVEKHASVARANIARAGLAASVDIRVGQALQTLPLLAAEGFSPIDLAFIDADKQNNSAYFDWALKLSRPGSVIVVDNVVREGAVIRPDSKDASVQGVRALAERIAAERRVDATAIQTVGVKGYDGFLVARVREKP